jgi:uncharacterized protein YhhL (DUF1145 family)
MLPWTRALCALSWIPCIGWITFLVNLGAPTSRIRRTCANIASIVASFVAILNILLWSLYGPTSGQH